MFFMSFSELREKGVEGLVKELLMVQICRKQIHGRNCYAVFLYGIKEFLYLLLIEFMLSRMRDIITVLMLMVSAGVCAQKNDAWVGYYDTVSGKVGYKDLKGDVMLPAIFVGVSDRGSFYNIMAVTEDVNDKYLSYYLLKDGRRVGVDSVYMFDFLFDCESEEKILFNDRKTDRVGFFDKEGKVVVPAVYNTATPFRNGISFALQNAKRKCADRDTKDCEHWRWDGGQRRLINERNEVLVEDTDYPFYQLDMYSLKVNATGLDTAVYVSLSGRNGKTYSFIDVHKELGKWLNEYFIPAASKGAKEWKPYLFEAVKVALPGINGVDLLPDVFVEKMGEKLMSVGFSGDTMTRIDIVRDWFGYSREDGQDAPFRKYYKACGGHDTDRFPLFEVVVNHYKKKDKPYKQAGGKKGSISVADRFYLEHDVDCSEIYRFIRTENGYKLYDVSSR
jgi:hypothetical protein